MITCRAMLLLLVLVMPLGLCAAGGHSRAGKATLPLSHCRAGSAPGRRFCSQFAASSAGPFNCDRSHRLCSLLQAGHLLPPTATLTAAPSPAPLTAAAARGAGAATSSPPPAHSLLCPSSSPQRP